MENTKASRTASPRIIKVFVCRSCDRDPARWEKEGAEGAGFLVQVRKLLKHFPDVEVKGMNCLGGCECSGMPNGCCSVGFASRGRFSYVFNQLKPDVDGWKVVELLKLYRKRGNGRIACADSEHNDALRPHVATRVPSAEK
ncbi:MAG: hypothetical protein DI585_06030 [Pseudomonas fluorescens]|nr:MAG: hypothetical protein DI585_06030 [Pseudomonas fluorescens]